MILSSRRAQEQLAERGRGEESKYTEKNAL